MFKRVSVFLCVSAGLIVLAGCVSMYGATTPGAQRMGVAQRVVYARITRVHYEVVNIHHHQLLATAGGAAAGGVLGSLIGGGRGTTLAEMAGVVAGGAAGHEIGKGRTKAALLTVSIPGRGQHAILEPAGRYHYHVGERVEIVGRGNRLRVIPTHSYGSRSAGAARTRRARRMPTRLQRSHPMRSVPPKTSSQGHQQ